MDLVKERLGKVAITVEKDYWSNTRAYDRLVIVEAKNLKRTFISRKPVPAGASLWDRNYWIPFSSLQEEFMAEYNAWTNKWAAKIENAINNINSEVEDVINNVPAKNTVVSIEEQVRRQAFYNTVMKAASTRSSYVLFGIKCIDCYFEFNNDYYVNYDPYRIDNNTKTYVYKINYSEILEDNETHDIEEIFVLYCTSGVSKEAFSEDDDVYGYVQGTIWSNEGFIFDQEEYLRKTANFNLRLGGEIEYIDKANAHRINVQFERITTNSSMYIRAIPE